MKKCLTLYDVTGIQNFVFSSNKAKENIGASIYIQELFDSLLISILKELGEKIFIDWDKTDSFLKIKNDNNLKCEVIYIGGGNAMLIFDSKKTAIEITKKLSKKILEDTNYTLGIIVAYLETYLENFDKDKDKLFQILNENKNKFLKTSPLKNISITRECNDGLYSSGKKDENGNFISDVAYLKREKASKSKYFDCFLKDDYKFPKEFDDLGQVEGDNHIAVVHIDGNSMGKFINSQLEGIKDYNVAINKMRQISCDISSIYKNIFSDLINYVINNYNKLNASKKITLKENNLPIRPLILSGDDITFVCNGKIAIQLANYFLKKLSSRKFSIGGKEIKISACAGVAIVKSHFPFYRAYELAEQLCSFAKTKAKALDKNNPGSWIDYHIVYGGFNLDLQTLRQNQYNVPDMEQVNRNNGFDEYNLLLRPFCISDDAKYKFYNWDRIIEIYNAILKFPRSRLKDLRNSFIISKSKVNLVQKQNKSRGYFLPEFEFEGGNVNDDKLFFENQTPYFEPLEILDFYINELDERG